MAVPSRAAVFVRDFDRAGLAASLRLVPSSDDGVAGEGDDVITVLLVILVLMMLGVLPSWPHSRSWGYAPSGTMGLLLVILLLLVLTGRI